MVRGIAIGHSQVDDYVAQQPTAALVALEVIGIGRNKVVLFASSTQSPFSIEVVTELVVLLGNVLIYLIEKSNTSINVFAMIENIETATNGRFLGLMIRIKGGETMGAFNTYCLTDIVAENHIQETTATGTPSFH